MKPTVHLQCKKLNHKIYSQLNHTHILLPKTVQIKIQQTECLLFVSGI